MAMVRKGTAEKKISQRLIKEEYAIPIIFYSIKDRIIEVSQKPNFFDILLVVSVFTALVVAFPFYPIPVFILILILLFMATLYHPFLGIIALIAAIFPIFIYQMPIFAWVFLFIASMVMVFGYMHYRTMLFSLLLISLSFSQLGYIFTIPAFIFGILIIGRKRSMVMAAIFIFSVVSFSGSSGLQNTGYVLYDSSVAGNNISQYMVPNNPLPSLSNFSSSFAKSLSLFASTKVMSSIPAAISSMFSPLIRQPLYLVQLSLLIILIIFIDSYVVNSRTKYKGTEGAIFGIGYPLIYILLSLLGNYSGSYITLIIAASVAPAILYVLELNNINIIKALDVRKHDVRMKFGEAFEDLQMEQSTETFADIGDYENTKKELKEAVLSPLESKGIARAYNMKVIKGIIFFGPPGTGKTMMMRALSNEIHVPFFYVKASTVISSFSGESEKIIAKIFATAKKHQPCILFFDEIDSIGMDREMETDATRRNTLSQILVEMDGFQPNDKVIVVGATNRPDLLDKALVRPGRFDKEIYMPVPPPEARKEIFKIYLKKLPLGNQINIDELVEKTERFSGADIKALCNTVAQVVSQEAVLKHKILRITQNDLLNIISSTKPSTSLSQIEIYEKFRIDFERSINGEDVKNMVEEEVDLDKVIGMDDAKKALEDAILLPMKNPEMIKKYNIKPINGILLFGPPGEGKTMLMKAALHDESLKNITMIELDGSELVHEGLDRAIETIKDTFNRARENEPAVIFIDEIDGITSSREKASEEGIQITDEFLRQMDGITKPFSIIIIAATNRPDALDPAILRAGRFDKLIFVKPPNASERADLFNLYISGSPSENIDYKELGEFTEGYSAADIAAICREAKTIAMNKAIKSGKEIPISMEDIKEILKKVRPSTPPNVLNQYLSFLTRYGQR